jgi:hypothetical protein
VFFASMLIPKRSWIAPAHDEKASEIERKCEGVRDRV